MHPVLLTLGPLKIYAYGTFLALAFIVATLVAGSLARKKGRNPNVIVEAALYIVIGAIVGSRILYVILDPGPYLERPLYILELYEGGLSLHGGILGGLLAGFIVAMRRRVPFWPYADIVAPTIALGTGIARVGCFLNGCCYGTLSDVPWATLTRYAPGLRHPAQIYEMLMDLVLFGYLAARLRRPNYDGQVMLHYVIGYSIVRFIAEFFRDSGYVVANLSLAQVASVIIILVFLCLTLLVSRKGRPEEIAPPPASASGPAEGEDPS